MEKKEFMKQKLSECNVEDLTRAIQIKIKESKESVEEKSLDDLERLDSNGEWEPVRYSMSMNNHFWVYVDVLKKEGLELNTSANGVIKILRNTMHSNYTEIVRHKKGKKWELKDYLKRR